MDPSTNEKTAAVDFGAPKGKLRRRLHSSGFMPNISAQNISDFTPAFEKLHFLEARTHDQALVNEGQRVVDTHFVFPMMNADPADPDNYFFAATDFLLETCLASGTKIMYRLGTSIEHTRGRHFNAIMPRDFEKYAEVLAGIVRHYNRGWANGFRWGIEYWEIWNEADLGHPMWDATLDDYHRFYGVVAKRLKKEFPEIKIGGPAFTNLRDDRYVNFLSYCKENDVPVDFLSWHCYTADAAALVAQPLRGRQLLDSLGFTHTETMINEWHYILTWEGVHHNITPEGYKKALEGAAGMFGIDSAAFNISVVAGWHDTPLDSAYYYGCGEGTWGFVTLYKSLNKNYYSMDLIGQMMMRFPNRVGARGVATVSLLAGTDSAGNCGILVADYRGAELEIPLVVTGVGEVGNLTVCLLDQSSDLKEIQAEMTGNHLVLRKQESGSAAFFITFQDGGR
jgi:xylan 1,4-beta-xylosidase